MNARFRPVVQVIVRCGDVVKHCVEAVNKAIRKYGPDAQLVSVEVCLSITRMVAQRPFNHKTSQQTEEIAMRNVIQDLNRLRQPNLLPFSAS